MPALPEEMTKLHSSLHLQRVVIVTPSAYGTDNSATLYGMRARHPDARGVVAIDDKTPAREIESMHRAGVCGLRLFLAAANTDPAVARERFHWAASRALDLDWHIQIFTRLSIISALKDLILGSPVPVVIDHFGGARGALGVSQPGFSDLLEVVASGRAYVKISAPYRFSQQAPDYGDMVPLVRALIAARPDRILWGSDWPHTAGDIPGKKPTDIFPFIDIDDGRLLNLFAAWVPGEALREQILVDNPARLYAF
jgi:predicted TIM-barrel fold metal-dependent hydrolase